MRYFESDSFTYPENKMFCEEVAVEKLASEFGTPLYIYSRKFFTERFKELSEAFSSVNHKIYYASKANYNINVIKLFSDLGAGIDVNSAGELLRAKEAGISGNELMLSGVGKTVEEIKLALKENVMMLKAESEDEVIRINEIAASMGITAPVAFRVNPDVDAGTHPYISTGLAENKFGIPASEALDTYKRCNALSNVKMCGIDMHIGSQITSADPFEEAVARLAELYKKIRKEGVELEHFDIGGGIGIRYNDEKVFTPSQLADRILPIVKDLDCQLVLEPGRFLTANGGILLTETLYTKENRGKKFIVADGAMTDLLRPSIYKAYHHIQPVVKNNRADITCDVVGPVCESGDFLAKGREIEEPRSGDLLAVMSAGAYGMVMASNYNGRRRAPEVMVDGNEYFLLRSRETYEHLLYDEKLIEKLHKKESNE